MDLKVSIGKTFDANKDIYLDLAQDNIHTIAFSGPTGSGKSAFHHSITKQITQNNTPAEAGFIFIDFKNIEYGQYKDSDYLHHPIISNPKEAVTVLNDLIHESSQRSKGLSDSTKAIVVHIEECDIAYSSPNVLGKVWKAIKQQSNSNNIYVLFSSSRSSADVFTPELLEHSDLRGWFVPGGDWYTHSDERMSAQASRILGNTSSKILKPWTRIFQPNNMQEIICKGYEY